MRERTDTLVRMAAMAGIFGPLVFGSAITALTFIQYDFMRSLRWHPLTAPTTDWPSGLALGPYGQWMSAAFMISGALLAVFGQGLRVVFPTLAPNLITMAGLALACLAFPTDPTFRTTPATTSGTLHDVAYVAIGLTLLPGMMMLARQFLRLSRWRWLAPLTVVVLILIVPAFVFKGILFYVFLAGIFVWCECVALRLSSYAR